MEFTTIGREKVYTGRAFDVERVHLRLPDGKSHSFDLVSHTDSITIVPVDSIGNILFVQQYRVGVGSLLLELPAGMMEVGEDPRECAEREIREETGMGAGQLELLGDFYLAPGYDTEHMFVFLATDLYPDPLSQDVDEFLQVEAFPYAQAVEMAYGGQIHDSKTLASLMLALPKLRVLLE
jgi:ADP-ribose pyrophosphatase